MVAPSLNPVFGICGQGSDQKDGDHRRYNIALVVSWIYLGDAVLRASHSPLPLVHTERSQLGEFTRLAQMLPFHRPGGPMLNHWISVAKLHNLSEQAFLWCKLHDGSFVDSTIFYNISRWNVKSVRLLIKLLQFMDIKGTLAESRPHCGSCIQASCCNWTLISDLLDEFQWS